MGKNQRGIKILWGCAKWNRADDCTKNYDNVKCNCPIYRPRKYGRMEIPYPYSEDARIKYTVSHYAEIYST